MRPHLCCKLHRFLSQHAYGKDKKNKGAKSDGMCFQNDDWWVMGDK